MAEDLYGANPYDNAYNDMDVGAGPSRPPPIPYDDPYSDSYGLPEPPTSPISPTSPSSPTESLRSSEPMPHGHSDRLRGRGRGKMGARDGGGRERGRGRGQDRRRGDRGRGRGRGRGNGGGEHWSTRPSSTMPATTDEFNPRTNRAMSPTSMAIARATGQYPDGPSFPQQNTSSIGGPQPSADQNWAYQQYPTPYDFNFGYQQSYVQPHINPRFASMFGMGYGFQQQQQGPYGQDQSQGSGTWGNEWLAQSGMHDAQPRDDDPQGP